MEFLERLTALRKERGLTQQALADLVWVHVLQIRRYEGGNSQPTLDVVKRLAASPPMRWCLMRLGAGPMMS